MGLAAFSGDLASYSADAASPAARDRLVMAVVRLCRKAQGALVPREAADQVSGLTHNLLAYSDPETRLRLAQDLSGAAWPSKTLIMALATGPIEAAAPILRDSPILEPSDLMRLVSETSAEHQIAIAQRADLQGPIIDLLMETKDSAVLTTLAENKSITLTSRNLESLASAARSCAALRKPLANHQALSESQAYGLYAWCDPSLRRALVDRFGLKTQALDEALASSGQAVSPLDETAISGQIAKLHQAGQLTSGFLVRALMDGHLAVFLHGLARLGDVSLPSLRVALNSQGSEPLALACRAVEIDRVVFPKVLGAVRRLNHGRPGDAAEDASKIEQVFQGLSPAWAARAFRLLNQNQV